MAEGIMFLCGSSVCTGRSTTAVRGSGGYMVNVGAFVYPMESENVVLGMDFLIYYIGIFAKVFIMIKVAFFQTHIMLRLK